MPKTPANPVALGTPAAEFALPDANGALHSLGDFADRPALVVAFVSNRCPFVVLIREGFAQFAREYAPRGLQIVAINSNDENAHPEESLRGEAAAFGGDFPYLKDREQQVAKTYGAACTPDLFLFDRSRKLAYHGQFDGARPGNGVAVTGADLRAAVEAVLAGRQPAQEQTPSIGCNIKWQPGNEPDPVHAAA